MNTATHTLREQEATVPPANSDPMQKASSLISSSITTASLMRIFGVLAMLAASSSFLLQGWDGSDDLERYYLLLAQTLLLAGGGLSLSYGLKENKGARAFFGLSMASVSATMAVLGALIFSVSGNAHSSYPSYLTWSAVDVGSLIPAALAGGVMMLAVLPFSHMVFARNSARKLAMLALFTNALLLVPVRESMLIGLLIAASLLIPALLLIKQKQHDAALRTPEGGFSMLTIFAPTAIMLVRSLWLYSADAMLVLVLAGNGYLALHFLAKHMQQTGILKTVVNCASVTCAIFTAFAFGDLFDHAIHNRALETFVPSALFLGLIYIIAVRDGGMKPWLMGFAATLFALACLQVLALDNHAIAASFLCVSGGVALLAIGSLHKMRKTGGMGALLVVAAMARMGYAITQHIDFSSWVSLSAIGIVAIVGASVIERHGAIIQLKWQAVRQHFNH